MSINHSYIQNEIAQILKSAREELGMDILKISQDLKIKYKYIQAIEEGNWQEIPGEVYVNGYIRTYAKYLGITDLNQIPPPSSPKPLFNGFINNDYINSKLLPIIPLTIILIVFFVTVENNASNISQYLKNIRYDDPSIQTKQFLKKIL